MVNSRWGKAFHEFRTNRNISLKQIADESVSIAQISRFERGESDISFSKLVRILENMHVEMNEFMDAANGYDKMELAIQMLFLMSLETTSTVELWLWKQLVES